MPALKTASAIATDGGSRGSQALSSMPDVGSMPEARRALWPAAVLVVGGGLSLVWSAGIVWALEAGVTAVFDILQG